MSTKMVRGKKMPSVILLNWAINSSNVWRSSYRNGVPHLDTFLDEQFHENWGQKVTRIWKDEGRFQVVDENHIITLDPNKSGGAGFFEVTIGEKTFHCLRVMDTYWATSNEGILVEAYLSQEGRTVYSVGTMAKHGGHLPIG